MTPDTEDQDVRADARRHLRLSGTRGTEGQGGEEGARGECGSRGGGVAPKEVRHTAAGGRRRREIGVSVGAGQERTSGRVCHSLPSHETRRQQQQTPIIHTTINKGRCKKPGVRQFLYI